jgi:peptide chain release factor 2
MRRLSQQRDFVKPWQDLDRRLGDLEALVQLAIEEGEASLEAEITTELEACRRQLDQLQLQTTLSGEYDTLNAILSINSGAGGVDAQDWVDILLRMYLRWAESHGYSYNIVEETPGEIAGTKSITTIVSGPMAYGYLKAEAGVHRLVRISPFDSNKRRHTSFASVDVVPEIDETVDVEISPDDLRVETYRASGAGGQHVNKTDSAVRITHLPTGIVVQCQNERSQHANRRVAMSILRSKLFDLARREQEKKLAELRGEQQKIEWGSQIRSYVFQPYTMVKDHRTQVETGNLQAVIDGDIDQFITAYLQLQAAGRQ